MALCLSRVIYLKCFYFALSGECTRENESSEALVKLYTPVFVCMCVYVHALKKEMEKIIISKNVLYVLIRTQM